METRDLHLRIVCEHPPSMPCEGAETEFGLQDKRQTLDAGTAQPDGSLRFETHVTAKRLENGRCDFAGPCLHGAPGARFLYLSLRRKGTRADDWIRRLKVPLSHIGWERIIGAERSGALEARISGAGSGTVPLLDGGWTVAQDE